MSILYVLVSGLAFASAPIFGWQSADMRAHRVFGFSATMPIVGPAMGIGLEMAGIENTAGLGATAFVLGPAVMAGSSLRSRHALAEIGATTPGWAGGVSWGLWGASMLSMPYTFYHLAQSADTKRPLSPVGWIALGGSLGTYLGSYAMAITQQRMNQRARRRLREAGVIPGRRTPSRLADARWSVSPGLSRRGALRIEAGFQW